MFSYFNMATVSRLDSLYDSNIPSVRLTNEMCNSYKSWYNSLISNITVSNEALLVWYNTWISTYDPTIIDISLSVVYDNNKSMINELQAILLDQKSFYDGIKASKLSNAENITFTYGDGVNNARTLKGKYNYGTVSHLASDIDDTLILNTSTDTDISVNTFLVKNYYHVGNFNEEEFVIDLLFGGAVPGNVSDLYDRVVNATDGTSLISQNRRLIASLAFNISRCDGIQTMLTYVKK